MVHNQYMSETHPNPTDMAEALATAEFFATYYENASKDEWKNGNEDQSCWYSGKASAYRHMVSVLKG